MRELSELPVFPSRAPAFDPETWRLRVDGLVSRSRSLSLAQVRDLPSVEDTSPFECVEGWRVPDNRWQGVAIATLLDMTDPLPQARYATFHAGNFIMSLSLEKARAPGVLLAYGLNGAPLTPEHGAPLRLVVPGGECYYGVKWVERVELTREAVETGKAIALERIQRRS
jgi:DMSO/TMAO reductase YedYZ molybdopterin-dependent catalytic subunit